MNILGHPYIAYKVLGRLNWRIVAGSHLPDLVPFSPDSVFSFKEIHESGDKLLPGDLGLAMMTHSVRFGADKFNREIEKWLLKDNDRLKKELALQIVECSGVSFKIAATSRIHNYLWSGVDVYLLKNKSQIVRKIADLFYRIDSQEIADILAHAFKKNREKVKGVIDRFFIPLKKEDLVSLPGLIRIWRTVLARLPEKDAVDEKQTIALFQKIYLLFEKQWQDILNLVIEDVKTRMADFLGDA